MKVAFFILLLFLLLTFKVRGQGSQHKESNQGLTIPDYHWDYNTLLPDTVLMWSQSGRFADSVRRTIFSSKEDSNKVWQYFIQAQGYVFAKPDSAFFYAQQGLQLAKRINFEAGEYYCTLSLEWVNDAKGNYVNGLTVAFNLLNRAQRAGNDYR